MRAVVVPARVVCVAHLVPLRRRRRVVARGDLRRCVERPVLEHGGGAGVLEHAVGTDAEVRLVLVTAHHDGRARSVGELQPASVLDHLDVDTRCRGLDREHPTPHVRRLQPADTVGRGRRGVEGDHRAQEREGAQRPTEPHRHIVAPGATGERINPAAERSRSASEDAVVDEVERDERHGDGGEGTEHAGRAAARRVGP